jgi:formylglycine-generating enzyme required for sulfatase activity
MKELFVLMKSGFLIFGIVVAAVMLWGCGSKSSPVGPGGNNTITHVGGMVSIPGGTFQMGSNNTALESETGNDEEPVHSVTVSSFYMDSTDVTQASYQSLMGVNPSYFNTGASASRRPVESMTWYDAVLYCNARSKHDGYDTVYSYTSIGFYSGGTAGNGCDSLGNLTINYTQNGYRLPTEAEWEYACRAGSTADYYWGQSYPLQPSADTAEISAHAWWLNSNDSTQPVATKPANAFGLHDMSGNVWQWCNDWYGSYSAGAQTNPTGPSTGSSRVLRGGSWNYAVVGLCAAFRGYNLPDGWNYVYGFRCVRR